MTFDKNIYQYYKFMGNSPPMQKLYKTIEQVAKSDVSVLITGETGTGKELCAKTIHQASPRWNEKFITFNCATLPHYLLESELFGHTKGAFTGADREKNGIARIANNSSLFLDEIGEMDFDLQGKLLRFVETGTFYQLGSHELETVDIRFIAATNREPQYEIKMGRFRTDLYYRLGTIAIHLPPLRERGQDVILLAQNFLNFLAKKEQKIFKKFTSEAEKILLSYDWPGNVRQLQNIVHSIVLLNEGERITTNMLLVALEEKPLNRKSLSNHYHQSIQTQETELHTQETKSQTLEIKSAQEEETKSPAITVAIMSNNTIYPFSQIEKNILLKVIDYCDGHVVKASELLGISYATVYRKLREWKIPLKRHKKFKHS